jgi:hypothetical protein
MAMESAEPLSAGSDGSLTTTLTITPTTTPTRAEEINKPMALTAAARGAGHGMGRACLSDVRLVDMLDMDGVYGSFLTRLKNQTQICRLAILHF